jgi:hypothetical protein
MPLLWRDDANEHDCSRTDGVHSIGEVGVDRASQSRRVALSERRNSTQLHEINHLRCGSSILRFGRFYK